MGSAGRNDEPEVSYNLVCEASDFLLQKTRNVFEGFSIVLFLFIRAFARVRTS